MDIQLAHYALVVTTLHTTQSGDNKSNLQFLNSPCASQNCVKPVKGEEKLTFVDAAHYVLRIV